MNQVQAGQIIYTRVERDQSPRGVSGFQTVGYTQALISEDVLEEAEHYFAFDTAETTKPKLVFGPVGDGGVLLARLVSLVHVDQCGRHGNFIAHGLILSQSDFLRLGGNPLTIARDFPFITDLKDVLARSDGTGNILAFAWAPVFSTEAPLVLAHDWSPGNLHNLLVLAACSARLSRRGPIAIIGSADDVLQTLELVFSVMPEAIRCHLSFDSRGTSAQRLVSIWAWGYDKVPRRHHAFLVDADRKTAETVDNDESRTAFGNWVSSIVGAGHLHELIDSGESAWQLCELIDREMSDEVTTVGHIDARLAARVWTSNRVRAESRLTQTLQRETGFLLGQRVADWFLANLSPDQLLDSLRHIEQAHILRGLNASYGKLVDPPSSEEQTELERLLTVVNDNQLMIWRSIWRADWQQLQNRLQQLPNKEYGEMVLRVLEVQGVDPCRLYDLARGDIFAEAIVRSRRAADFDLNEIVAQLLTDAETSALSMLTPMLARQSPASLVRLRRNLRRHKSALPAVFFDALERALARSKRTSRVSWLRRIFG